MNPPPPPAALPSLPVRSIAFLAAAAFASAANMRISDPLLPQVAAEFATTAGVASVIVTFFTIAYGLLQAVYGPIGDRFGKYAVIAITTLVASLATLACALAPSLELLAAARFASAATSCAVIPLSMAWLGDVVPFERRQAVLSQFISGQIMGMVFGQAAGGMLGDWLGWRMVFVVVAGVQVAAGVAIFAQMRFDPATRLGANPHARLNPIAVFAQFAALLRRRWVRIVILSVWLEGMLFFASFAYIGNALHQRFGISFTFVGVALSAYGAGGIIYSLSARYLLRRIGERGLILGGGLFQALALTILALATSLWLAVPAIALCGLGFYMFHNTLQTNGTQMAPEARGSGIALFASALFVGQSIGVALAAPVVDRWGEAPVFLTSALLLPAAAIFFRARLRHRPTG